MGQESAICNPLELIKRAGLRATSPRVAVLSYLAKHPYPVGIKDIKKYAGKRMDLVTLYRMMDDFLRAGLVTRVNLGKGRLFELKSVHDHHHIVCTNCSRVEDFSDESHEKIVKRILKKSNSFSHLTGHSFELYGVCTPCSKRFART